MVVAIPASASGKRRLLIGGEWRDAASGKEFETRNPATGELLATVSEGDAADIDLAVAAARRAFEGPWSRARPYDRQRILLRFADLVEQHIEELLTLDFLEQSANVILVGPNGVGKTMIAKNLLHQAILRGYSARFVVASDMLHDLAAQDSSLQLARRLRRYTSVPLLCIDEVGYLSYDLQPRLR